MNTLELRRRTLGKGVYKKTVEGNPAIAQGSLARRYPGITMQGWTEQDSTTGAQLFNVDSMKQVTIPGGEKRWGYEINIPAGSYTLSTTNPNNITGTGVYLYIRILGKDGEWSSITYVIGNQSPEKNIPITLEEGDIIYFYDAEVSGTNEISKQKFQQMDYMLNTGSSALSYEPYTGGAPSPSPDYPQEIVSAGEYDEGSGKYQYTIKISDSEESPTKSQTVTLTADRPLTKWDKLTKKNGVWGWVYKSAEIVLDGSERWYTYDTLGGYIVYCINTGLENGEFYISNFQESRQPNAMMDNSVFFYAEYFGFNVMTIRYDSAIDLNQFKNFLGQNSITLVAQTAEETFVPLSALEQEQMNALHTFRPTTVLSNDCGCEMTLTYKTKKSLEVTT